MKTNLSSQITLTRIPARFYRPENAYEQSVLTQFENIPTTICASAKEGSRMIASEIARLILAKQEAGQPFVIALPGGRTPQSVFRELIRIHKEAHLSFRNVVVFNLYEFYPLVKPAFSNLTYLKDYFLDHVDIKPGNIHSPDGFMSKDRIYDFCVHYEQEIEAAGGLDFVLLGVGHAGNISFNIPGSAKSSVTRLVLLDSDSRKEASKIFKSIENIPAGVITMGVSTILAAQQIVLMAWGEGKAGVIKEAVEGKEVDHIPASYLQSKTGARFVIDLSAAYKVTRINHPWLVTNC